MGDREKIFLGFLVLFISIVAFIGIILYTFDFENIKVNAQSDKMMRYLSENQYEQFFENLSCDEFSTSDEFTQYQKNINELFGEIEDYKYIGTYSDKNIKEEECKLIEYDVNFSKVPDEIMKITLGFVHNNNKWRVSQYKIGLKNVNDNMMLVKQIKYLKANSKEKTNDTSEMQKMIIEIMQNYDNEEYKKVYASLNSELKKQGNENEFINYLENQHNKYGKISAAKFNGYETGKDKSEYKLNYCLNAEDGKIVYITFWVQKKDKLYLSGTNFSEDIW